ncbi:ribonuclease P protein subunit p40-like isoform X1 [Ostrea edulis]|uniref:ribonuclease P protein subunit p40-like isoform X1 n=1 Tax=Ostrea edulis TaxID=37623 RepID=UPI0024AF47EF|nr:ribonuclease P protein subunit p40-like isoform X1 [Ostrea edulis]
MGSSKMIRGCWDIQTRIKIGVTMTGMDMLPPNIEKPCKTALSYIVYNLPVHELINPDLIGAFQRKGSLCMLSHGTRLEVNDCVTLLPTGRLILHLTKDSYTRLGLDGKLSRHNKYGGEKYVLEVDVGSTVFVPGKKHYDRVKSCLQHSNIQCDFLVSWEAQDKDLCGSSIHKYFNIKGFNCVPLAVSSKFHKYTDVEIPDLQHQDAEIHHQEELYDWLGGVANQITLSNDDEYNPMSDYTGLTKLGHCAHMQISGLFLGATVQSLIQEVRLVFTRHVCTVIHLYFRKIYSNNFAMPISSKSPNFCEHSGTCKSTLRSHAIFLFARTLFLCQKVTA